MRHIKTTIKYLLWTRQTDELRQGQGQGRAGEWVRLTVGGERRLQPGLLTLFEPCLWSSKLNLFRARGYRAERGVAATIFRGWLGERQDSGCACMRVCVRVASDKSNEEMFTQVISSFLFFFVGFILPQQRQRQRQQQNRLHFL